MASAIWVIWGARTSRLQSFDPPSGVFRARAVAVPKDIGVREEDVVLAGAGHEIRLQRLARCLDQSSLVGTEGQEGAAWVVRGDHSRIRDEHDRGLRGLRPDGCEH